MNPQQVDWSQFSTTPPPGHPDAMGTVAQTPQQVDWSQFSTVPPPGHPDAAAPNGLQTNDSYASTPAKTLAALAAISGAGYHPADVENSLAAIGGGATTAIDAAKYYGHRLADAFGGQESPATTAARQALEDKKRIDAPLREEAPFSYAAPASAAVMAAAPLIPEAVGLGGVTAATLGGGAQAALTGDNPGMGALYGLAGGTIAKGLGGVLARAVNANAGRVAPEILDAQATAQAVDGPVTLGDIYPASTWTKAENLSKHFYGSGRSGIMKDQTEALANYTNKLLENSPGAASDLTPEAAVVADLKNQYALRRGVAQQNYSALDAAAQATGKDSVPVTATADALGKLAAEYDGLLSGNSLPNSTKNIIAKVLNPSSGDPLNPVDIGLLRAVKGNLTPTQLGIFESASPGITARFSGSAGTDAPALTFAETRQLRSGLKALQRDNDLKPDQGRFVGDAVRALEADQGQWTASLGDSQVGGLARAANAHYLTQVAPYNNSPLLSGLLKPGANTDSLLGQMGATRGETAKTLMGALGPDGQNALSYGLMQKRLANAVTDNLSAGVSTSRIMGSTGVGQMPGMDRAAAAIYSPETAAQVAQLRAYAELARRSPGWAAENATGIKSLPFGAAAALFSGNPLLGAAPFIGARGLNILSKSPAFQRLYGAQGLGRNSILPLLGGQASTGLFDSLN